MAIIALLWLAFEPISAAAQERLAAMRASGQLRVCVWPEYYAISWRNPRSGELEGLDAEMARALATRLGLTPAFVETSPAGMEERLASGGCDIAMMAVPIQPERTQRLAYSKPYLSSAPHAVTTAAHHRVRGWADMDRPSRVVAVAAGTPAEAMMRQGLRQARLLVLRPPRSLEAELLSGRADAVIADLPFARGALAAGDWARVIAPPPGAGETLHAYAVAPGDPAWLAEVNAFLTAAKADGSLARTAARFGLADALVF